MSKQHSKQDREEPPHSAVDQRIAELAELVAAGCTTHVAPSAVREEFEALVDDIRARAGGPSSRLDERGSGARPEPRAPRESTTRLIAVRETVPVDAFEWRSDPEPESTRRRREPEPNGSRVVSIEEARRVIEALRSEETTGGGPREDLQRAIA